MIRTWRELADNSCPTSEGVASSEVATDFFHEGINDRLRLGKRLLQQHTDVVDGKLLHRPTRISLILLRLYVK